MLQTTTLFFVFKNKNCCYLCCFYHERLWLANLIDLISSSTSIGSLNKRQLAEMLLRACNCYQL